MRYGRSSWSTGISIIWRVNKSWSVSSCKFRFDFHFFTALNWWKWLKIIHDILSTLPRFRNWYLIEPKKLVLSGFVSLSEHRNLRSWTWIIGKSLDISVTISEWYSSYNDTCRCSEKSQIARYYFLSEREARQDLSLKVIDSDTKRRREMPDIHYNFSTERYL